MRDGTQLATDIYFPPVLPGPVVVMRTPYGRAADGNVGAFLSFARRGYIVVSQDCRGTGASEPDSWDYYMYESEDGYDLIEWITHQDWFGGFLGACGGSYVGQTQWCMALHPAMSTIAPHVSGLGVGITTARLYMFLNAYARVIGKGADKIAVSMYDMERVFERETLSGGLFNEPLHSSLPEPLQQRFPNISGLPDSRRAQWLWEYYCGLSCAERAQFIKDVLGTTSVTSIDVESLPRIFGHCISHDAHTIPHRDPAELCKLFHAPPLLLTGWYDWCLHDALATWELFRREAQPEIAARSRMIITPHAHNMPGYHEGADRNIELIRLPGLPSQIGILLRWYAAVREGKTDAWPRVIYYLMGANEWHVASDWPVPEAKPIALYLGEHGALLAQPPPKPSLPDRYTYDPCDPTPTVGGSIVSYMYPPGSVDVSEVQQRPDVLVYTSPTLDRELDVVGPLRMILYASSSAVDTDFVARLSDVFPDGRAVQLQSGILRARYRDLRGEPELLEPGRIYRLEIDLWATANRFKRGHRLRVDISSADFPHYDRNGNLGGEPGDPIEAHQSVFHDAEFPSHLLVRVLGSPPAFEKGAG
jgi:predicted acyl esterase